MKIKTKRGARRIRNQRVVCKRFVVTDYTGCSYITAGKWYKVTGRYSEQFVTTINDYCSKTLIATKRLCPHLDDVGTWRYPII